MCIIIYKPEGKQIDKSVYEKCWDNNEDGLGVAFVNKAENRLEVKKGIMKKAEAIEFLVSLGAEAFVAHFRRASPGMAVSPEMTHPFFVETKSEDGYPHGKFQLAMVHNGRLEWRFTKDESDTHCFFEDVISPHFIRDPYFLNCKYAITYMTRMTNTTGYNTNKLVFMRFDSEDKVLDVDIIKPELGYWDADCWYSNNTFRYARTNTVVYVGGWNKQTGPYTQSHLSYEDGGPAAGTCGGTGDWPLTKAKEGSKSLVHSLDQNYKAAWSRPDENGWKWDFDRHLWANIVTGLTRWELTGKHAPYSNVSYRLEYEAKQEAIKNNANKGSNPGKGVKHKELSHLTKAEIKTLVGVANVAIMLREKTTIAEINRVSYAQRIETLRMYAITLLGKPYEDLEVTFLDEYIIKKIHNGTFEEELSQAINEAIFDEEGAAKAATSGGDDKVMTIEDANQEMQKMKEEQDAAKS